MFSVFKRVAALAVLVFVVSCAPSRNLGNDRQVPDNRISICVSNETIDAMNVRISGVGGSVSIFSRNSRWVRVRPDQIGGGTEISANPVGGGDRHYAPLYSLSSARVWLWDILTFPSSSFVSLRPARGDTPCD